MGDFGHMNSEVETASILPRMMVPAAHPPVHRLSGSHSRRFYLLWALILLILLALAFYRDTCQEMGGDCEDPSAASASSAERRVFRFAGAQRLAPPARLVREARYSPRLPQA